VISFVGGGGGGAWYLPLRHKHSVRAFENKVIVNLFRLIDDSCGLRGRDEKCVQNCTEKNKCRHHSGA
jgi:hypothetical protein